MEFVAQGKISIEITVSFLVAIILLILSVLYRQQDLKTDWRSTVWPVQSWRSAGH